MLCLSTPFFLNLLLFSREDDAACGGGARLGSQKACFGQRRMPVSESSYEAPTGRLPVLILLGAALDPRLAESYVMSCISISVSQYLLTRKKSYTPNVCRWKLHCLDYSSVRGTGGYITNVMAGFSVFSIAKHSTRSATCTSPLMSCVCLPSFAFVQCCKPRAFTHSVAPHSSEFSDLPVYFLNLDTGDGDLMTF